MISTGIRGGGTRKLLQFRRMFEEIVEFIVQAVELY